MKYIGKSKTYSSAAIAKSAIVALTRRNLDLPLLVNIKGNNYVTLDDAVKLLRGLVLDEKNLIDLLPKVEGLPSAQLLLITLKEEELIKEHQRSLFSNTLGLFPETVRTAVSKQSPDTIVAEIYPILIALGYEHQAAIDYWNNTLSQQIIEGESQQVSRFSQIFAHFRATVGNRLLNMLSSMVPANRHLVFLVQSLKSFSQKLLPKQRLVKRYSKRQSIL
jgi:hypothetical protein